MFFQSNIEIVRKICNLCIDMHYRQKVWNICMVTSSNGNIFRVAGPWWGEFTCHRWIPLTKQWRGALVFSLICTLINCWVNNREAGDLRRHFAHYGVTVLVKRHCYTRIWHFNLLEIAWHQPRTSIVILMQFSHVVLWTKYNLHYPWWWRMHQSMHRMCHVLIHRLKLPRLVITLWIYRNIVCVQKFITVNMQNSVTGRRKRNRLFNKVAERCDLRYSILLFCCSIEKFVICKILVYWN